MWYSISGFVATTNQHKNAIWCSLWSTEVINLASYHLILLGLYFYCEVLDGKLKLHQPSINKQNKLLQSSIIKGHIITLQTNGCNQAEFIQHHLPHCQNITMDMVFIIMKAVLLNIGSTLVAHR